jgi:hypothetical protein
LVLLFDDRANQMFSGHDNYEVQQVVEGVLHRATTGHYVIAVFGENQKNKLVGANKFM